MKKLIFGLLLLWPTISNSRIVDPIMENYSGILNFCTEKVAEYEEEMNNSKSTQIYVVYRSKRDAYLEILDYIQENQL